MNKVDYTSKPVAPHGATEGNEKPEFIRLPLPGKRCPFTGLSRSTLNELTIDGPVNEYKAPVKSHVLRKRGATRGIRLISFDSLMAYIRSLSAVSFSDEMEAANA